jgi:hypothetical protein
MREMPVVVEIGELPEGGGDYIDVGDVGGEDQDRSRVRGEAVQTGAA